MMICGLLYWLCTSPFAFIISIFLPILSCLSAYIVDKYYPDLSQIVSRMIISPLALAIVFYISIAVYGIVLIIQLAYFTAWIGGEILPPPNIPSTPIGTFICLLILLLYWDFIYWVGWMVNWLVRSEKKKNRDLIFLLLQVLQA